MIEQIDFYVLNQSRQAKISFACRLLDKAWKEKKKTLVLCEDSEEMAKLDELLWTYHDTAFLPHVRIDRAENAEFLSSPILLTTNYQEFENIHILLNLSDFVVSQNSLYSRVIEIIPEDEELKIKARERFTQYRQYEVELKTHRISI